MKLLRTFATLLLTTTLCVPMAAQAKKKDSKYDRPYDMFFEDSTMWGTQISPDGNYLATARRDGDNHILVITNLNDPKAKPSGINLGDKLEIQWVEWVNNDRIIYSVFKPWEGSLNSRPIVRLFGIDKDGKNNEQFFRNNEQINSSASIRPPVSMLTNDKEHIMIPVRLGDDLDVLKVNVNNSKSTLAAKGQSNTVGWLADIQGNAAFRIDLRDRGAVVEYHSRVPGTNGKNAKFRLAKEVRRDRTSNSTNLDFSPIGPAQSPTQYYVIGRPNGANFAGVYLYDFEQNAFVKEIFTPPAADVISALVDDRSGTYQGSIYRDKGRVKYQMASKRNQAHMNALEQYFGDTVSSQLIGISDDQNKLLFRANGPSDPGSYHLYDKSQTFAEEIGLRLPEISNNPVADGRIVSYKARDGLELYGYLSQPTRQHSSGKAPLIMMPHGGPEARSDFGYNRVVQLLNWKGYQVFEPNFRGSTGRGLKFADLGRRQWGRKMQNDVDDAFAYLVSQGIADADKACIMGFSYGGYSALAAATLTPNKYQCVIAGAAPADLFEMLNFAKGEGEFGYNYWTRHIGHRDRDAQEIAQYSPAQLAANIDDPVLIMHGERDSIVPYEQGEIMRDAMKEAGKDVTFIRMNDTGHWFPAEKDDVRNTFYDGLFAFLDEHLPAQ